jgi:hypothetical protein
MTTIRIKQRGMSLFDIIMALLSDIGGLFSSLTKIITLFLFYLRRPTIVQAFNSNMFMVKSEEHKHEGGKEKLLLNRMDTSQLKYKNKPLTKQQTEIKEIIENQEKLEQEDIKMIVHEITKCRQSYGMWMAEKVTWPIKFLLMFTVCVRKKSSCFLNANQHKTFNKAREARRKFEKAKDMIYVMKSIHHHN